MDGIQPATVYETSKLIHTCHSGLQRIGARAAIPKRQFCYPTPKHSEAPGVDGIPADTSEHTECFRITTQDNYQDMARLQAVRYLEDPRNSTTSQRRGSNYRTIAPISHASKTLQIILLNRLRQKFENEPHDEEAGFRLGRRTADMLCCNQNVIEKALLLIERICIAVTFCQR